MKTESLSPSATFRPDLTRRPFAFELAMHPPDRESKRVGIQVHDDAFDHALRALPRDHDLPRGFGYLLGATQRAEVQQEARAFLAKHIARSLTRGIESVVEEALLKLMAAGDTIHGYSPEEWREMHAHGLQP